MSCTKTHLFPRPEITRLQHHDSKGELLGSTSEYSSTQYSSTTQQKQSSSGRLTDTYLDVDVLFTSVRLVLVLYVVGTCERTKRRVAPAPGPSSCSTIVVVVDVLDLI